MVDSPFSRFKLCTFLRYLRDTRGQRDFYLSISSVFGALQQVQRNTAWFPHNLNSHLLLDCPRGFSRVHLQYCHHGRSNLRIHSAARMPTLQSLLRYSRGQAATRKRRMAVRIRLPLFSVSAISIDVHPACTRFAVESQSLEPLSRPRSVYHLSHPLGDRNEAGVQRGNRPELMKRVATKTKSQKATVTHRPRVAMHSSLKNACSATTSAASSMRTSHTCNEPTASSSPSSLRWQSISEP